MKVKKSDNLPSFRTFHLKWNLIRCLKIRRNKWTNTRAEKGNPGGQVRHLHYYCSEDRYWNWLWDCFWKPCYVARGKQTLGGKIAFHFPEIGRVETGWGEVVVSLWRQRYLHPHQPVMCQVETRWQTVHHKGCHQGEGLTESEVGGTCLVPTHCSGQWMVVGLSWAPTVCWLALMASNTGRSHCFKWMPATAWSTSQLSILAPQLSRFLFFLAALCSLWDLSSYQGLHPSTSSKSTWVPTTRLSGNPPKLSN